MNEELIDDFTKEEWAAVARALDERGDFGVVQRMLTPSVQQHSDTVFSTTGPDLQFALHQSLGFLKFANMLADLRARARYVSERGGPSDSASRGAPM